MNMSRGPQIRWVIDGAHEDTRRFAKALAAEHGLRVADVVDAAILAVWRGYNNGSDVWTAWEEAMNER